MATLKLNASAEKPLDWRGVCQEAEKAESPILWEFDFALLGGSLTDEVRYLTLELAVLHFAKELWPRFQEKTEGIILFRGPLTLQNRGPIVAYLQSLAAHLPTEVPLYLVLETDAIADPMTFFRLITSEIYGSIGVCVEGKWGEKYPSAVKEGGKLALLPPERGDWTSTLEALGQRPFRVIAEPVLTQQWDGVDDLIVFSEEVGERSKRKLLGFCAAEGRVVTVGPPIGLPNEISIETFLSPPLS